MLLWLLNMGFAATPGVTVIWTEQDDTTTVWTEQADDSTSWTDA